MKVLMLLIGHDFPPDIRVEKESRTLLAAGHQVTVVCENRKNRPSRSRWNDIEIIRLPSLPLWLRRLNTATLFITLHSPLWEREIGRVVQQETPDVLHIHNLPFVGPGLRLAREFDIPLVADLHENYPALLNIRLARKDTLMDRFIFNPQRFARYEKRVLPLCDRIIVVVEEAAERVRRLGVPRENIFVVGNTEDIDATASWTSGEPIDLPSSEMTLLYIGGFGPHRGLETVIKAMPVIIAQIPSARFVIVGDGPDRQSLESLVDELNLNESVHFAGWQPLKRVYSYIQASDVGLVPHVANPHTNATMPHKLFQYMYMKKPVIVSSAKPLKRVVLDTNAGLVFKSNSPESFASCVLGLQDQEQRDQMGQNGNHAVKSHYNWRREAQELIRLYQSLE
jgi:glycosyltransferase involved in cell wall biosynthesis